MDNFSTVSHPQQTICANILSAPVFEADTILSPCWLAVLHLLFYVLLIVTITYNFGILLNFSAASSNISVRYDRLIMLFGVLLARAVLSVALAIANSVYITILYKNSSSASPYVKYVMLAAAVACYTANASMDCLIIARGWRNGALLSKLLSMLAITTHAMLAVPIVALHALSFRLAMMNLLAPGDDKFIYILLFALQMAFLFANLVLVAIRRHYLKEMSNLNSYSNLLFDENDGQPQDFDADRSGAAESVEHQGLSGGFLSWILFLWVNPLIQTGSSSSNSSSAATTRLESTQQLFQLPNSISSNRLELQAFSTRLSTARKSRIFLIRALLSLYGWNWIAIGIIQSLVPLIQLLSPLMLNGLVTFIAERSQQLETNPNAGLYYAAGMVLTSFVVGLLGTHCAFQVEQLKLRVSSACMDMVYSKILRVRACEFHNKSDNDSEEEISSSSTQVMNLLGTDCVRVAAHVMDLPFVLSMPIRVGLTMYMLYAQVGWAFAGGLALPMLFLLPTIYFFTNKMSKYFEKQMSAQDGRVKLLSECLSAIRTIKLHAWEPFFLQRLERARAREMHAWKRIKFLDVPCNYCWDISLPVTVVITFVLYVLFEGQALTAAKVFTTIAIFHLLMEPLNNMPYAIKGLAEMWIAVKRLQKYLSLTDIDADEYYDNDAETPTPTTPQCMLKVENCSFSYNDTLTTNDDDDSKLAFSLENITFNVKPGELIGVVGAVGSGKTSLLMAIMAEMHRQTAISSAARPSRFSVDPEILRDGFGCVLQEPWVQQGTVKENILCRTSGGVKNMLKNAADDNVLAVDDQEFYDSVIDACALRYDVIQALPRGDATDIGEQGVTLSGGQRARIALARACYARKSLVLLDDPLAAVDAQVGRHIFDNCIRGLLLRNRKSTVVLVTHHVEYLRTVDADCRVIVMRDGKIDKFGPASEVLPADSELLLTRQKSSDSGRAADELLLQNIKPDVDLIDEQLPPEPPAPPPPLVDDEEREYGVVRPAIWKAYCRAMGWHLAALALLILAALQVSLVGMDYWLAMWASHHSDSNNNNNNNLFFLQVYIGIAIAHNLIVVMNTLMHAVCSLRQSRRIHNMLLNVLLCGTQRFYDSTPSGRIINRYGSDISTIDFALPWSVFFFVSEMFDVLGTLVMICIGLPWFMLAVLPALAWYIYIQNLYRKTSRELERLVTLARSPMYSWFSETLKGLTYIRAMRLTDQFHHEKFRLMLDGYNRARYAAEACAAWLNLRLQMFGVMFVLLVVVLALAVPVSTVGAALVGLTLAYSLSIVGVLQSVFENFISAEQNMVAVERVMQYVNGGIEREVLLEEENVVEQKIAESWPERGEIEFINVKFCYAPGLPLALNNVTLNIAAGEKIAFVGRTGAGKSSLFQALFRTVPLFEGRILIDGVDISHIRLSDLRSRLAIIPQAPALFDATLRANIDPLGRYDTDADDNENKNDESTAAVIIDDAIRQCMLQQVAERLGGKNGSNVGENGALLSQGERQLVCLARALVMRARIICLDEATASVDVDTDMRMQHALRTSPAFAASTVLCIAHRIQTVRDYDRVAVLHDGRVVECGRPTELLKRRESYFYQLANAMTASASPAE